MPASVDRTIVGLREMVDYIKHRFPREYTKVLRGALREGCHVYRKAAKSYVPYGKGYEHMSGKLRGKRVHLRDTISIATKRQGRSIVGFRIHAGKGLGIAHLVEFGTAPHWIAPKAKTRAAAYLRIGSTFVGGRVYHPGSRAIRFMSRAFDNHTDAAISAVQAGIRKRIKRLENPRARRGARR